MPRLPDLDESGLIAAIDMGSNSFHLAIARLDGGVLTPVISQTEKVRLGAGLDANSLLTDEARLRALACLSRFACHLDGIAPGRLRAVGTQALRVARNADDFLLQAGQILGHPVDVISGQEEARLIYQGVAHTLPGPQRRLVIDIGGGSTELIIGERFDPLLLASTPMGCVSHASRFFADGCIHPDAMECAITAARHLLAPLLPRYRTTGWNEVIGSSGTFKAMCRLSMALGLEQDNDHLSADAVQAILRRVLMLRHVSDIDLPGIKDNRKALLPAGLSIVVALFEELGISSLTYSDGALREGLLYDMTGIKSR
jgi:exopolyphosphatase/guanosine-5'-triphosphate,3'-diphosphate pyrophosphatase